MSYFSSLFRTAVPALVFAAASASQPLQAGIILSESFDTDGSIADYSGSGKIFSDYVLSGADAAAPVSGGGQTLSIVGNIDAGAADSLYAHIDLGSPLSLLSVQLDYTGVAFNAANSAFQFYAGAFDELGDFNPNHTPSGSGRSWAKVTVGAGDPYSVRTYSGNDGGVSAATGDLGQAYTWRFFFNDSDASQTYSGPDGLTHMLNDDSWSFFIDNAAVGENLAKGDSGALSGSLEGLIFNIGRNFSGGNSNSTIGNILVRDDLALIPEPASGMLLGLGGLLFILRRRRSR